jgi:hypothetical protein
MDDHAFADCKFDEVGDVKPDWSFETWIQERTRSWPKQGTEGRSDVVSYWESFSRGRKP